MCRAEVTDTARRLTPEIETARLRLKQFAQSDLEEYARIYSLRVVYYTLCRIEYQPDDSVYVLSA